LNKAARLLKIKLAFRSIELLQLNFG